MRREAQEYRPIVLLGATGLLGRALLERLDHLGRSCEAVSRETFDLAEIASIPERLRALDPSGVINASAYSDVARAERPEQRREVYFLNRDAPAEVARACAEAGIPFAHVSTDYVFDGRARAPYREGDPTGPVQVYGRSKLDGELAVKAALPGALIVRTSTLFGPGRPRRPSYVDAILQQAARQSLVEVVEPPVSSPTYTPDLAEAILRLLDRGATGVVHVANSGSCSRLELARAVVELAGLASSTEVRSREAPPGDLRRPPYSVLDTSRFSSLTGRPLRPWRNALAAYLELLGV